MASFIGSETLAALQLNAVNTVPQMTAIENIQLTTLIGDIVLDGYTDLTGITASITAFDLITSVSQILNPISLSAAVGTTIVSYVAEFDSTLLAAGEDYGVNISLDVTIPGV